MQILNFVMKTHFAVILKQYNIKAAEAGVMTNCEKDEFSCNSY